jgi:hypothetical protein
MASFSIQTIKFEFKQTNQETTPRYRPPAPAAGGSAGGIDQAVAPGPASMWVVPLGPSGLKPCRPLSPPRHRKRTIPPNMWALPPLGRTVTPVGSSSR